MKAIILAAGMGARLGKPYPKPLTILSTGESILDRQIRLLSKLVSIDDIYIVIGFKKELIMEKFPQLLFVYNNYYDSTNTSKSLLCALKKVKNKDVIWLNGDVVFSLKALEYVMNSPSSCMAVNNSKVSEEEVKYKLNNSGEISEVSKSINNALGEAVGINKVKSNDLNLLIESLENCNDSDYFEKAIEKSIKSGMKVMPVNLGKNLCIEIDFEEDLDKVNSLLSK